MVMASVSQGRSHPTEQPLLTNCQMAPSTGLQIKSHVEIGDIGGGRVLGQELDLTEISMSRIANEWIRSWTSEQINFDPSLIRTRLVSRGDESLVTFKLIFNPVRGERPIALMPSLGEAA